MKIRDVFAINGKLKRFEYASLGFLFFAIKYNKVPPSLIELSIYDDLHLPHLEGYFISEKGQFKLTAIAQNKTLLQGTTWYRHKIWPGFYWRLWSDHTLHKIHYRVLNHIKNQTEKN